MITAEPDITRLLARMKVLKLIRQQRDKHDRRVLWTQISTTGLELLDKMDGEVAEMPRELLGHLNPKDLSELIRLLELARKNLTDVQEPVSCTGERCETNNDTR